MYNYFMKQTPLFLSFIFIMVMLAASGCSVFKSSNGKVKPGEELMDEIVRSKEGGYEFQPLQGYKTSEAAGTVSMFLPQGDQQSGPGMILSGLNFDQSVSLEQAEAVIRKTYPAYEFGKSKPYKVDQIKGVALDFTTTYHAPDGILLANPGADEGEEIQGRILVVMVSPTRQFRCTMLAPADQWNKIHSRFEKVIKSVQFLESKP